MKTESQVLGSNVRRHRKAAGWTQEQLAIHTSLSSDYISRLELGKENPSLDVLVRLSRCYGVALPELFRVPDSVRDACNSVRAETVQKIFKNGV
ncbi:MAG: helix-turn-helix domain-containing protein [Bacteroidota bacterium]